MSSIRGSPIATAGTTGRPAGGAAGTTEQVHRLRETIAMLEAQRQQLIQQRRLRTLALGAVVSLLFHVLLMTYLGLLHRGGGTGESVAATASYDLAILNQEELTELEHPTFDDLAESAVEVEQPLADLPELNAAAPDAALASAAATALPSLGATGAGAGGAPGDGSGGGLGLGGGGGGGGTSFFGISSKGTRFAYIVDVSGSMGQGQRIQTAMRELARSIDSIPDYASFYILLFSDTYIQPPMQKGWTRAAKSTVRRYVTWLNQVEPNGGTQPRSSFLQVFSLDVRPDVIFFLTDGEFSDLTPEDIAALNSRGKRAIINTIQFGDPGRPEILRAIAEQSGGLYRFVASGG